MNNENKGKIIQWYIPTYGKTHTNPYKQRILN